MWKTGFIISMVMEAAKFIFTFIETGESLQILLNLRG